MDGIVAETDVGVKGVLRRRAGQCQDARLRVCYLIILNLMEGRTRQQTAQALGVSRTTVWRVAKRFCEQGEVGLLDRREDNGQLKVDERYLATLYEVVSDQPEDYGWPRSTWTQPMLVETLEGLTGVRVHVGTMSRALEQIGARRARPRPTVACPWSPQAKGRRLKQIQRVLDDLPDDEVAVYEDEIDIHLNPKIGLDWMVPGQQKEVPTPGKNVKRHVAGAMDVRTQEMTWVESDRKTSDLFIGLVWELPQAYPDANVIHVILDNYRIHSSRRTKQALAGLDGRVVLHFLPPYCPEANKIERYWEDFHADVTRNHRCRTMDELMERARAVLRKRQRRSKSAHKGKPNAQRKKRAA